MSDASVIKEFLVGLGFKVDDAGFKKFSDGLALATKTVMKLGVELAAVAAATEAAVAKVSSQFEDLYYASQRIGSTVENIRGFGFALSQVGGTAAGARAALENVAEFMRTNPGGEGFIASLGVQTRDANGQMRDTADILADLGKQFRAMPYFAAKARAGMLGIDPITLQALMRGTDEFRDRYHRMAQLVGVDQQAAAAAGHRFMVGMRDLLALAQLLGEKFILLAQGPAQRLIDALRWLSEQAAAGDWSAWTSGIQDLEGAFSDLADAISPIFDWLGAKWRALFGEAFGDSMKRLAMGFVNGLIDTFHLLADAIHGVAALLRGDWKGAMASARQFAADGARNDFAPSGNKPASPGQQPAPSGNKPTGATQFPASPGSLPLGLRNHNPGNLRSWGNTPTRNGFAVFGSDQEGLSAMAGNLLAYGRRGLDTIQSIISTWAPKSENDTAAYVAAVAKQLGVGSGQHVNLRDPQVLAGLMAAITQHENGRNPFSRDLMLSVAQARLGAIPTGGAAAAGPQVTINQKTDVRVMGGNAQETGREVAGQQGRVNGDLVRTVKGALG